MDGGQKDDANQATARHTHLIAALATERLQDGLAVRL